MNGHRLRAAIHHQWRHWLNRQHRLRGSLLFTAVTVGDIVHGQPKCHFSDPLPPVLQLLPPRAAAQWPSRE